MEPPGSAMRWVGGRALYPVPVPVPGPVPLAGFHGDPSSGGRRAGVISQHLSVLEAKARSLG